MMWSSWLSNGIFTTKKGQNSNLQQRINGLYEEKVAPRDCSPTLKELQQQKNKVRRMSSVYEENISAFSEDNRSLTMEKSMRKETSLSVKLERIMEQLASPRSTSPDVHKVHNSMKYILDKDAEYIEHMDLLIEKYVKEFENIPALRLRNESSITERQKEELFGPIEKIYDFHNEKFHLKLMACGQNVVLFAKVLSEMCINRDFNPYLVYALDEKVNFEWYFEIRVLIDLSHRTVNIVAMFITNSLLKRSS